MDSLKEFVFDFIHREEGQMAPMMMTALLIGYSIFMGAAIDMGNLLWHKNHATTAANAACMAGAADLVWVVNQGTATALANYESSSTGFKMALNTTGNAPLPGSSISGDCGSASSSIAMCAYAEANGYKPNVSGNDISWTVSNVPPPQQTINPGGSGSVASFTTQQNATPVTTSNGVLPFLHVAVTEEVPTYLLSIMPWFKSPVSVTGYCDCGVGSGVSSVSQEQTLTGQCSIAWANYSNEWQIASVSPDQLRTTGSNFPTDYINFACSSWTDSQGNPQPQNYLTTIPGATIDGVSTSIDAATQDSWSYYAVLAGVELIASNYLFTSVTPHGQTSPYTISGEPYNNFDTFITGQTGGPFPYYTVGSATTMWGVSKSNMMNALASDHFFGMAVYIQGNGDRVFVGGGFGQPPYITVYYHTGGYYATMF
jgi:hypothetical protein